MKNKILLSLLSAIGLMAVHSNAANFVEVANLGSALVDTATAGTINATVIIVDQRWTRDKVYILTKNTIIKAGVTVTVEPGTLIRCEFPTINSTSGILPSDPGALVAHRGGRLIMNGTADAAIIMTTMDDHRVPGGYDTIPAVENLGTTGSSLSEGNQKIYKPYTTAGNVTAGSVGSGTYTLKDGLTVSNNRSYSTDPTVTGNVFSLDAKYGGIVLAGRANISARMASTSVINNARTAKQADGSGGGSSNPGYPASTSGAEAIEGMAGYTGYTWFGGDDDLDDSGVVRFVQCRYGGYVIASGRELNGFTWCAAGQRTLGEFIESFSNADDDNEFFGGCVGVKYAIGAYGGDDGFDTDQGYSGVNQFLLQLQNSVDVAGNSTLVSPSGSANGASGKRIENAGDHLCENDGPENIDYTAGPGAPLSVFTHANYTGIGRGYGPSGWVRPLANVAGIPFSGPNFRDNASGKIWNALYMDIPHAGPTFAAQSATSDVTSNQTDTVWHLQNERSSGGYDNSGVADDLVTAKTDGPGEPDLLIRNSAWFRCGLADTVTTADANDASGYTLGKYATRAAFNAARTEGDAAYDANWWVASRAQICPVTTLANSERTGKGSALININPNSASSSIVGSSFTVSTSGSTTDTTTGNSFNLDPGYVVPIDNRTAQRCLDFRLGNDPTATSGARTTTVALPTRGNLNPDANFTGAFRDNNWARNWTMLERAGVFATDSAQIAPQITVGVIGSNPTLTFATVNGVKYSIEASVDNRHYRPLATVTGDGTSKTYQVATGLNASATSAAPYSSSDIVTAAFDTGKRTTSANTFAAIPATIGSTPLFFRVMAF